MRPRLVGLVGLTGALSLPWVFSGSAPLFGADTASRAASASMVRPITSPVATTAAPPATTQPDQLTLPAIMVADETVELHAKASGYVSRITVDYGSLVHRGDVLMELFIPELTDELHQAEATVKARRSKLESLTAKANEAALLVDSARAEEQRYAAELELADVTLKRKTELYQGKAIPPQEFDVARNAVDLAKAQIALGRAKTAAAKGALASAQADAQAAQADVAVAQADVNRIKTLLKYTKVTAPFDGVITRRNVNQGTFVRSAAQSASEPLLTINKVDVVRLVVDVPEASAPRVHPGTPVTIAVSALGGELIRTRITRTARAVRQDTRTMRAEIDLDNAQGRFMPGLYARVNVLIDQAP